MLSTIAAPKHRGKQPMMALLPLFAALILQAAPATAGTVWLPDGGGLSNVPVNSMRERKYTGIVRQQFDFSCGSAAVATLLSYHYEDETSEQAAFDKMFETGDQEKIRQMGFSLLDMKKYLESKGYEADGYHASLDTLATAAVPAIALINVNGYRHFVVIKGMENDKLLVGDPALGIRLVRKDTFESIWENGILFIIRNRSTVAKNHFNSDEEWNLLASAPIGETMDGSAIDNLTLNLPEMNDYPL